MTNYVTYKRLPSNIIHKTSQVRNVSLGSFELFWT